MYSILRRLLLVLTTSVLFTMQPLDSVVPTTTPFDLIRDFNESLLEGTWAQIYSNRFVQETREVGWKCVTVDIHLTNDSSLHVTKTAFLQGNRTRPIDESVRLDRHRPPSKDELDHGTNDTVVPVPYVSNETDSDVQESVYTLRDYDEQYNYLVWTKNDNASIFVWTRNVIEFKVNFDWHVLEKIISWNYTGYYLFPMASYTFQCMDNNNQNNTSS